MQESTTFLFLGCKPSYPTEIEDFQTKHKIEILENFFSSGIKI